MSASDNLQPQQFVHHSELAQMYSGDHDEPMHTLPTDSMFTEQAHPAYKGDFPSVRGSRALGYVKHLAKGIKADGMQEPIEVRGGNVVTDGHHRALAAMKLKMDKVPVRHVA